MQTRNRNQSLFHDIKDRYHAELKRLNRKKFLLKARLLLTIVLPFFITILAIKAARTFIRIKVRDIFSSPEDRKAAEIRPEAAPSPAVPAKPVPVSFESVEKEIVTPSPVEKR